MKAMVVLAAALMWSQPALGSTDMTRLSDTQLAQVTGAGGFTDRSSMLDAVVDNQRSTDLYTLTHTGAAQVDVWLATGQIQLIAANVLGPPPIAR